MAQTYTSDWQRVSNGDITTHNPQELASTSKDIKILSADVQWEGVTMSSTSTIHQTATNTDSDTGSTTTSYSTITNGGKSEKADYLDSVTFPSVPSGYSFDHHELAYYVVNDSSEEWGGGVQYQNPDGASDDETVVSVAGGATKEIIRWDSLSNNYVGETRDINEATAEPYDNNVYVYAVAKTISSETSTSGYASTTYPSVPDGYSFDYHDHHEYRDGSLVTNERYYSSKVGQSESISTSTSGETIKIELETVGENTITTSVDTQDPRVTRDVLGESGGMTLNDGEQSQWISLSGLSADEEEFYHDIDGSETARFRFRFDWETKYPDALKQLRVGSRDGTTIHKVSLADPADSQLAYNHVRTRVDGTVYAIDVVDPSDPDAISWLRIGTPQGVVCPRAFGTVT